MYTDQYYENTNEPVSFKGKDQIWSCDCIVKETLWNRSEKVDHLASSICKVLESSK